MLFISAVACSGAPRTADPTPRTGAQPKPAPQRVATANAASVAATAPGGDVDLNLVKAGYSVLRRHNAIYYCRTEIITGNRIATRICLTAAQIQDEKHDVTKAKDIMNQPSYQCLGGVVQGSPVIEAYSENSGSVAMKLLFPLIVVALSACTTLAPPRQHSTPGIAKSSATPGTVTITGDELQQTGRTELSDALRASSPIFH